MTITDTNNTLGGFQIINPESSGADATGYEGFENYFGFEITEKYTLPDGKQWIAFKPMNEGARAKYEQNTQKDIKFKRNTDEAQIKVNAAGDRHALILDSVVDWYMVQPGPDGQWVRVPFSGGHGGLFNQWLQRANPKIVNELHAAIQKANPWMVSEMTSEAIREEIKRLEELLAETELREARQKNS